MSFVLTRARSGTCGLRRRIYSGSVVGVDTREYSKMMIQSVWQFHLRCSKGLRELGKECIK